MSLFGRLNRRAITWDKLYGDGTIGPVTASGRSISEAESLKYSVVWSSVNLIADAVALLTPEAFSVDELGAVTMKPVPRWIESPHPEMRRGDVWGQLIISALLWGNGYALLVRRDSDGAIIGMYPLDPKTVECEWDPNKPGYKRYRIDGTGPWLNSGDIFHLQGPTLPGHAKGLSVIAQAREAIGLGLTLEEFGARYFSQGSMAKVVIKVPGKVLEEKQALEIVRNYERFHRGRGNWHRPAVLSGPAGIDIENISIPPEDSQFLGSREHQALDVARWFRVPPHRVGIMTKQSSWGSGLSEENMAMVQHTFRPWIRRLEDILTRYSPGGEDRGMRIRLQDSELLRGTFKEQVEAWGTAVEKSIATPDEARKAIGLDPIEGGDKLIGLAATQGQDPNQPQPQGNTFGTRINIHHDQIGRFASKGTVKAGTRYDELSPKGRAAVDATMEKYGVSAEALDQEIASKITPEGVDAARAWYVNAREFNQKLAEENGLTIEQATAITSAVSPRCPWPRNKQLAEAIAKEHTEHSDVSVDEAAKRIGGGLTANIAPAVAIARGGSVDENLTGVKRRSFYNNMLKPAQTDDVTVDVWMMKAAQTTASKPMSDTDAQAFTYASKVSTGGGAGYVAISESVRRVADQSGLSPDEVQSAYWIAVSGSTEGTWGRNG